MGRREEIEQEIQRLKAERRTADVEQQGKKIQINGSFGKFGSAHSILYSPDLLIQTTISGQLYLLMFIEALELAGLNVISANTDGVVTRMKKERYDDFNGIVGEWERSTGFGTEETKYFAYFARDVGNYFTVKEGGSVKLKGCFGDTGISKNPAGKIIYKALTEHLVRGVPIDDTITSCTDIREFVFVRKVEGGAKDGDGNLIGKVIRYYRALGEFRSLKYASNGNKVPESDGCVPLMEIPVDFPQNVDYKSYSRSAKKMLSAWVNQTEQLTMDF